MDGRKAQPRQSSPPRRSSISPTRLMDPRGKSRNKSPGHSAAQRVSRTKTKSGNDGGVEDRCVD